MKIGLLILVVLGLVLVVVFAVIGIYNKLVTLRNRFKNAWAQIDVQLKRRYDLIPNLVETAKGYLKHERGTLEAVIAARNAASSANIQVTANPADAGAMKQLVTAETSLTGALGRLFAVAEAYPDLKASENFLRLQEDLTDTEDKISAARRYYNSTVMHFNTAIQSIPWVLVAKPLGFRAKEFFSAEGDTTPPQVSFSPTT